MSAAIPGDGNRLLAVCRHDTDRWDAPGGYLERDETVEEAVGRTVWEKTGLLVRPVILTGVYKDMDKGVLTEGDVAILRFLAAAELIESDLWQQYNELGGAAGGNPAYKLVWLRSAARTRWHW